MGSFDINKSSSFKHNSSVPEFVISYADGHGASGIWGTDYVTFGGMNVSDCSMGVVNKTTVGFGVLGIALPEVESTNDNISYPGYTYENLPIRLKTTGAINKIMYSLYLNGANALSGSVLFGAVDHAKYSGKLQTVPIINFYEGIHYRPIRFDVVLDSLTLESASQNASILSTPMPALLDSGTSFTFFPEELFTTFVSMLDATSTADGYQVSCAYQNTSAHMSFNFSGKEIRVPLSEFIAENESKCYLTISAHRNDRLNNGSYLLLGETFLRSAYVVYDLEDYEISLAQAKYSDEEKIEVVTSSIPLAVRAPGYSSTSYASSATSLPVASHLSPSGWKQSNGSNAMHFASSLLASVIALSMVLVL